jgi:hypothetical protein
MRHSLTCKSIDLTGLIVEIRRTAPALWPYLPASAESETRPGVITDLPTTACLDLWEQL